MYVKAIIKYLKDNGSIPKVIPIGSYNKNMNSGNAKDPYVVVYESILGGTLTRRSTTDIVVMCCYPKDYQQWVDNYILFELFNLLDRQILTIVNGDTESKVKVEVTDRISALLTNLDDGYIGKERIIEVPYRWR